jgi:hypothetical protein
MKRLAVLPYPAVCVLAQQHPVGNRPAAPGPKTVVADDSVELLRTICFDSCPAYTVRIFAM